MATEDSLAVFHYMTGSYSMILQAFLLKIKLDGFLSQQAAISEHFQYAELSIINW